MCVFSNIGNNYSLKAKQNYCQLRIDYEPNDYIAFFFFFLEKMFEVLAIPVATESLLYLTPPQAKGKFPYPLKS